MTLDATIDRDELADALERVAGAVGKAALRPVLAGVLIQAHTGGLRLSTTDTEIGVTSTVACNVTDPGVAVVSHAKLREIVRAADGADVRLTRRDNAVVVKCGGRWELPTMPADEFPEVPDTDAAGVTVTAGDLRTAVKRTAYAADRKDSTRFALASVQFTFDRGELTLAATDSKRLAVHEIKAAGDGPKVAGLIPPRAVDILTRTLGDDDGAAVVVVLRPTDAVFHTPAATIYTRLVEGRFPPYLDILGQARKGIDVRLELPVAAFLAAVRQAAIMTDEQSCRVDAAFGAGRVVMQARGAETGAAEVELALPDYAGPDVAIAFDPRYLGDLLKSLGGAEAVTLEMSDGTKPALFRCGQTVALIMPLGG